MFSSCCFRVTLPPSCGRTIVPPGVDAAADDEAREVPTTMRSVTTLSLRPRELRFLHPPISYPASSSTTTLLQPSIPDHIGYTPAKIGGDVGIDRYKRIPMEPYQNVAWLMR